MHRLSSVLSATGVRIGLLMVPNLGPGVWVAHLHCILILSSNFYSTVEESMSAAVVEKTTDQNFAIKESFFFKKKKLLEVQIQASAVASKSTFLSGDVAVPYI